MSEAHQTAPDESRDELTRALEALLNDVDIWRSMALIAACQLDVFGAVEHGAVTALTVARAIGSAPEPTARLLSALHEMGYLEFKDGSYRNAPVSSTFLVPETPYYLGSWLKLQQMDWEAWGGLTETVRTGRPPSQGSIFRNPLRLRALVHAAHDRARLFHLQRVLSELDLSDVETLIDVGGGAGTYSLAFCQAYPNLQCTIFDLPDAIEVARETTAPYDWRSRIHFQAGDFTCDSLGGPFDAAFLCNVLHGESPNGALALLRRIFAALGRGGRIIIRDSFLNEEGINDSGGAVFSLALMIETLEGRTHKLDDVEEMLRAAGFVDFARPGEQVLVGHVPASGE